MSASLVGSEMCIRDRRPRARAAQAAALGLAWAGRLGTPGCCGVSCCSATCLLYTSDAADDM
eukprot:6333259-Alexandrium_andersonii.AAC.1